MLYYNAQQKQIRFSSYLQGLFRWYPRLQSHGPLSVSQSWLCDASAMCFVLLSASKKKSIHLRKYQTTQKKQTELCTRASNVTSTVIKAIHSTKTSVTGQSRPSCTTYAYFLNPILKYSENLVYCADVQLQFL